MGGGPENLGEQPPLRFGDYAVIGHLATGGMAEVYIARKTGLHGFEKIVVIKRVRPDLLGDSNAITHFLDEARLVATLEHPNIAQVYEVGYAERSYFFVMEYVDGVDLRQLMHKALKHSRMISLADATILASMVDMVAFVVKHNENDKDMIRRAVNNLRRVNAALAGAVLNSVDIVRSHYKEYYYLGYYYYGEGQGRKSRRSKGTARLKAVAGSETTSSSNRSVG